MFICQSTQQKYVIYFASYQQLKQGVFVERHRSCTERSLGRSGCKEQSPELYDKSLESRTSKNLLDFSLGRISLFHQKKRLELMECCNHINKQYNQCLIFLRSSCRIFLPFEDHFSIFFARSWFSYNLTTFQV